MQTTKKRATPRKRSPKSAPRPYVEPETASELGVTCATLVDGEKCGKAVLWFDYALGEKDYMQGFVCDEHRVSKRVEKLKVKEPATMRTAGSQ